MKAFKVSLKVALYAAAVVALVNGLLILLVLMGAFGKLPGKESLQGIRNPVASEVYSADGVLMGKYYIQNRQYMDPGQITDSLRHALVATEDVRFYTHHGVDARSLARVLFKTLLMGKESSGGGSTLTQQLAKNLYPRHDHGLLSMPVNKVREMAIARRIEKLYTKEEILALYLSTVPFGENTFGIRSASVQYFSKEPVDLRLEETALLVGMLKATGYYNPKRYPDRAKERRNVVLAQMTRYGFLGQEAADSLGALPVVLQYNPLPHNAGIAPYFREYMRGQLDAWCREHTGGDGEPYNLYTDGLKIYTTVDSRLQQYAEEAMGDHMRGLQKIFEEQWKDRDLWAGMGQEQILINYGGNHRKGMELEPPHRMEVFSWDGMQEKEYNTLDSVKHYLKFLQAGFLAMDVQSGQVKAWVGGINHQYFKYDHVLARRQVGSAFKPLVYLAALEHGISPCDYFPNDSVVYTDYDNWTPRNADRNYGGFYSLKGALVHSVNTVSVNLLMEVGIDTVIALAEKAGITSPLPSVPSLALGTGTVSLLEMVRAYQSIANGGFSMEPVFLSRIEDKDGKVIYQEPRGNPGTPVCTPENAELMIEMLRGVVNNGTAAELRSTYGIMADIAGKTGTTQNYTDGYFMGFTPSLVAGVWVGGDLQNLRFRTMQYGRGSYAAMPIWAGFMNRSFRDREWGAMATETFRVSESTLEQLDCEDFAEEKPFRFQPFKIIKEKRFFKKLRERRKR